MRNNPYTLRDAILDVLNRTYNPDWAGKGWYPNRFSKAGLCSQNIQLTTDILATVAFTMLDAEPDHDQLENNILNIIWANYAGGGAAQSATDKIMVLLESAQ